MKLAPRMIQSMEILQLAAAALEERIEEELANNPTLEQVESVEDAREIERQLDQEKRDDREGERELVVKDGSDDKSHADDFERLGNLSEEYGEAWESNTYDGAESHRLASDNGERDAKMEAMANTAARPQSLVEQLTDQWSLIDLPGDAGEVRKAGEHLIGFIDDDGYIRTDWRAILDQAPRGVSEESLKTALNLLQRSLEPPGLAARDLRECLLLQIDAKLRLAEEAGEAVQLTVERLLVSDYLKDIENNRLPKIAQATHLTLEQVKQGIHNLRQFHPHPGRELVQESPQTIRPDVTVEYDESEDRYTARLSTDRFPNVAINPRYLKMAKDRAVDTKTRQFVGNNLRSARWLIDAIQQRHATLLRVVNVVLQAQREFFDQGPQHLRPLPMTLVADQLGVHVATVSRAVNEKYLQTPRGIFPLRMFFTGGTETDTGESVSWAAVQAKLQEVIDAEDKSNPLSDDELVVKLKEKGIEIARRTVAKYRKQMNIAPARQRKQY